MYLICHNYNIDDIKIYLICGFILLFYFLTLQKTQALAILM